jgi:hypothetical protein
MNNELTPDRALVGELSTQLQEAMQARTNMGVSLRLAEARLRRAEAEVEALRIKRDEPKDPAPRSPRKQS